MEDDFTPTLFYGLFENEGYFSSVITYLKPVFFEESVAEGALICKVIEFYTEYTARPSTNDIFIMLDADTKISIKDTKEVKDYITELFETTREINYDLLKKQTELWVQDEELKLAIVESVEIIKAKKGNKEKIHELIEGALAVNFDTNLGHDYLADTKSRFANYVREEKKFYCNIDVLNVAVGGAFESKALYLFQGRTNIGKTLVLCHLASDFLRRGYNVLYITAEMSEYQIAKRIDANLLDIIANDLNKRLNKERFFSKAKALVDELGTERRLKIKEFPTGSASVLHVKKYLHDLKLKKKFVPQIIIYDYLNLFASSRLPAAQVGDKYGYIKAVAEEVRGLGVEEDVCQISATQFNRKGAEKKPKDADLEDTADSWGIPQTTDWQGLLFQTDELIQQRKMICKVGKTRFDENNLKLYTFGIDKSHMRLINLEKEEQKLPNNLVTTIEMADKQKSELALNEELFT